jgi:hypothetical protein
MNKTIILAALLVPSLVSTTAPAQQKDRNLYFQSPDGSINVIVSGGPGYVITPFPNGSCGYNGYTVSPSYPPLYHGTPPASPYLGSHRRAIGTSTSATAPSGASMAASDRARTAVAKMEAG